jgi:hypothetical protein
MSWFSWVNKKRGLGHVSDEQLREYVNKGPQYRYQCVELHDFVSEEYLSGLLNEFGAQGFNAIRTMDIGSKTFLILQSEVPSPWVKP